MERKQLCALLGVLIILLGCAVGLRIFSDRLVSVYSPSGIERTVKRGALKKYLEAGWTYEYENASVTMYSADGRLVTVPSEDVEAYKSVGWFDKIEDAASSLYTDGGKELVIFRGCAESYSPPNAEKWKSLCDASTLLYDKSGKSSRVFTDNVAEYLENGWLRAPSEIDPSMKLVALTFDDGPSAEQTPRLLDICEKYGAHVTFYVLGSQAEKYPQILARAAKIGCEVGSHTYSHKQLTKLSSDTLKSEIEDASAVIESATGRPPRTLRPPYGAYNASVAESANAAIVLWSIDTLDWSTKDADQTVENILSGVRDGDIILLHDIYSQSIDAAERVIPALQSRGYILVTVEELINLRRGKLENGKTYRRVEYLPST